MTPLAALAALLLAAAAPAAPARLPRTAGAFPGCEGAGCETRGGFDAAAGAPVVHRVTTLADDGPGSLRACIAARGPRVCVFAVGGTIRTRGYVVANPYLTIDGRTAPGGGVQLTGEGRTPQPPEPNIVWIRTHDVVIRGLRMRPGWQDEQAHALLIWPAARTDDPHHVVLDHNSFSLGKDGNVDVAGGAAAGPAQQPRDVTLSYNVIAEALDKGGAKGARGLLVGADRPQADRMTDHDFHHNLFASNGYRNPLFMARSGRFVNNVLFNWRWWGLQAYCGARMDVVGNLGRAGPAATRGGFVGVYGRRGYDGDDCASGDPSIHLDGNAFLGRPAQGWDSPLLHADSTATAPRFRREAPLPPARSGPPIVAEPAHALVRSVVGPLGAGAGQRLDCGGRLVESRDAADARVAAQWESLPAFSWSSRATVSGWGGYPVLPVITARDGCAPRSRDSSRCACADADGDGLPDLWETAMCGTPTGCAALAKTIAPPWTNLEAFLSGAFDVGGPSVP